MLIVFVSIAVLGISTFIIQRLSQNETKAILTRCIYLAQAGIHRAIYDYRRRDQGGNGYFSLGQTNIDANNYFILSANAGQLLMVNTSAAALGPTGGPVANRFRRLLNLTMQKATNSQNISIDRMIVTWNNARLLHQIRIRGSTVWDSPPPLNDLPSPADVNINNVNLNNTNTVRINWLEFNGNMTTVPTIPPASPLTITIQFIMTDGSSRTVTGYPASNNFNFSVDASGGVTGSNMQRTMRVDYNALTALPPRIVDLDEIP